MNYFLVGALCTALGSVASGLGVLFIWQGQQKSIREATAKPVVDMYIDRGRTLHFVNNGPLDVEDVSVNATTYHVVYAGAGDDHAMKGIDSYGTTSQPVFAEKLIHAGEHRQISLAAVFTQMSKGYTIDQNAPINLVFAFRVAFRNPNTKDRLIKHLFTTDIPGLNAGLDDLRNVSMAGPFDKNVNKWSTMRGELREHQLNLYDDDQSLLYR